jgi:hypothetical protein
MDAKRAKVGSLMPYQSAQAISGWEVAIHTGIHVERRPRNNRMPEEGKASNFPTDSSGAHSGMNKITIGRLKDNLPGVGIQVIAKISYPTNASVYGILTMHATSRSKGNDFIPRETTIFSNGKESPRIRPIQEMPEVEVNERHSVMTVVIPKRRARPIEARRD